MSCYRPLTIVNPKLVKDKCTDSQTLIVPCGHCPACKDTRRLSWFVRLYYEWKYCFDNGGFALFETLTYNNENLPRIFDNFDFSDMLVFTHHHFKHLKGLPCFSRRHIQLYLKRIRKALTKFYPNVDFRGKFKYWLSMELGSKTHRPHYHVLFFVSTPCIGKYVFKNIIETIWNEKGFTKPGSLNDGFVCDLGGISYCSKYVCKDLYEEDYWVKVLNRLEKCGVKKDDILDCLPRNMQSINLGVYALEYDKLNDLSNFMDGNINIVDKLKEVRSYKLPLYYERKLFYDVKYRFFDEVTKDYILCDSLCDLPIGVDYSPVYILNELGLKMKDNRLQKSVDAVANIYRIVQSIPNLPTILEKLNNKFDEKFRSISEFQQYIKNNISEKDFVSYSLLFRRFVCQYDYHQPVIVNSDLRYNYNIAQRISLNHRLLSVDYNNFNYVADKVTNIPYIEDNFQMVRYVYFLIHLELENIYNKKEFEYIEQKTAYLLQTEPNLIT